MIRSGIQERITIGQTDVTQQGLLIWKLYLDSCPFTIESDADEIDLSLVTESNVFKNFGKQQKHDETQKESPIEEKQKFVINTMYTEGDSDEDSDFEQIYKVPQDEYTDLK